MGNVVRWDEGLHVVLDSEVVVPAAGWTVSYASVLRCGPQVTIHIEAAYAQHAAGLVTTLPAEFAPDAAVTTPDGNFTISTNGQVSFTGSTASASGTGIAQAVFAAALVSP